MTTSNYVCPVCGYRTFSNPNSLEQHMKDKHKIKNENIIVSKNQIILNAPKGSDKGHITDVVDIASRINNIKLKIERADRLIERQPNNARCLNAAKNSLKRELEELYSKAENMSRLLKEEVEKKKSQYNKLMYERDEKIGLALIEEDLGNSDLAKDYRDKAAQIEIEAKKIEEVVNSLEILIRDLSERTKGAIKCVKCGSPHVTYIEVPLGDETGIIYACKNCNHKWRD